MPSRGIRRKPAGIDADVTELNLVVVFLQHDRPGRLLPVRMVGLIDVVVLQVDVFAGGGLRPCTGRNPQVSVEVFPIEDRGDRRTPFLVASRIKTW